MVGPAGFSLCNLKAMRIFIFNHQLLIWIQILCAGGAQAKSQGCGSGEAICPIQVPSTGQWAGSDGSWSAFSIELGTPPQKIDAQFTLPNGQVVVNVNSSCTSGTSSGVSLCPNPQTLYRSSGSSSLRKPNNVTFRFPPQFSAAIEGYDKLSLSLPNANSILIPNQLIFSYNDTVTFDAQLGLGTEIVGSDSEFGPSNFIGSLTSAKIIANSTWGFKQGARYRNDPGQLTLGGFDQSQYEPNDAVFENSEGNFSLRLGRLSTSLQSGKSIIPNQVDIQISLNDTFIRLPKEACQAFESTFKLVFNEKYGLYTVDDNLRSTLKSQNLKFTFTLEDKGSSGKSVDIVVPYNSFDLKTDLPLTPSPMNFFPLLCEGGPSLGRAFLQEAYLAADNDKKAFYVFQAKVPKPKRFAPGKIAAISIGGAVFLGLVVAAVYEFLSRMHRKKRLSSRPTYRFSVHNLRKSQGTFPESPRASNQSTSTRGLSISNIPDFKNSTTRSSPPIYSPSPPSRPASSYYGPPVSIPSVRRGSERSSFHQVSNPVSATSTHPIIIDASQQSPFLYPTSPTSPIDRASVVPLTRQPTIAATRHRSLDSHPEPKVYIPPAYYSPKPGPSGVATRRASEGYYSSPTRTSIHRSRDFGTQRLSSAPGGGSRYSAFTARGPVSPMSPLNPASEVTASPVQEQAEGRSNDPFKIAQEEAQQQPDPAKFKYGRRWSHLSR